jgi:hypothetical protein
VSLLASDNSGPGNIVALMMLERVDGWRQFPRRCGALRDKVEEHGNTPTSLLGKSFPDFCIFFFPDRETRRDRSANVICFQLDWKEHNQLLCVFDTSEIILVSFGGGFAVRYLSLFLFFYFSCWVFIFFAVLETHGRHGRKAVRSAPTEFQLVTEKRSARVCLFSSNKTSSIFSSRDSYL